MTRKEMYVLGGRQQITLPCVYLCNNPACSSHVPQNLKCNLKKRTKGNVQCGKTVLPGKGGIKIETISKYFKNMSIGYILREN